MAKQGYVGIEGKAREITDIYVGIDGKARKVKRAYVGVDGKARMWFSDVKPGTYWIILSDGKTRCYAADGTLLSEVDTSGAFVAPMSGSYTIEMHGGGGGGAGGIACDSGYVGLNRYYGNAVSGSSGGGSGEMYNIELVSKTSYLVKVGAGGKSGSSTYYSSYTYDEYGRPGSDGESTTFGDYSVPGGKGAAASYMTTTSSSNGGTPGAASGSLASAGERGYGSSRGYSSIIGYDGGDATGPEGGSGGGDIGNTYGAGGKGGNAHYNSSLTTTAGDDGADGAIKIVFNG